MVIKIRESGIGIGMGLGIGICLLASVFASAEVEEANSSAIHARSDTSSFWTLQRLSLLAGPAVLRFGSKTDIAPTIAMRYQLISGGLLSFEAGSLLPHTLPASTKEQTDPLQFAVSANIHQMTEEHVALVARCVVPGAPTWIEPEVAIGISLVQFRNEIYNAPAAGELPVIRGDSDRHSNTLYDRFGLRFHGPGRLALILDTGYEHYPNSSDVGQTRQSINLGLSGWITDARVEWRM